MCALRSFLIHLDLAQTTSQTPTGVHIRVDRAGSGRLPIEHGGKIWPPCNDLKFTPRESKELFENAEGQVARQRIRLE